MRRLRPLVLISIVVAVFIAANAIPALAQELPKLPTQPPPKGGICAPWHRCAAYLGLGMTGIATVLFGLGYLVQSRGFDKLEHKQGNPEGVPVAKE